MTDLSNNLINKFIEITSQNKQLTSKEGTIYGTTVEHNGSMYVKLDGTDLLTPIETTTNILPNERVIVMIKNHNAIVTGNITSPSVGTATIEGITTEIQDTGEKLSWLISKGDSATSMELTPELYKLITSKVSVEAGTIDLHGYVTANNGFKIDLQGNMTANNGTFNGDIKGSTFSSVNDTFKVMDDGMITANDIVVDNAISANELNIETINNPEYQKNLYRNTTVYIDEASSDSSVFENNSVFTSFDALISLAPRNLNGYKLYINLNSDYNGDIDLSNFNSGQVILNMNGNTIYGYINCSGTSMLYSIFGNKSTSTGICGSIMPNAGIVASTYHYAMRFEYCNFSVTDVNVYPDIVNGDNSSGICVQRARGCLYNINVMGQGKLRYLLRAEFGSHVYVSSSSGLCNNATFVSVSGSYIGLNDTDTHAGTTNTSPKYVSSGGMIAADNVTFTTNVNSGSNTNTGTSTSKKVTYTGVANHYRRDSYIGWKNDNTARQGTWGYGNCTGYWFFGEEFLNIQNKNVTKIVIEFVRQTGGYSSSVVHKLYTHNHESKPSGAPSLGSNIGSVSLSVGQTGTLTITNSSTINAIKNAKGIAIQNSYSKSYYSVCSSGMKVTFYYS